LAAAREPAQAGSVCLADMALGDVRIDGADVTLPFGEAMLRAVLTQLIRNAQEAGATDVHLIVRANTLEVINNGPVINDPAKIFEPFYTTKRDSGGTGMGLAIVRGLLDAQGARINVRDQGDGFVIRWP